jgi:subtilisin-like proprotein convertase family protein
MKYWKWTFVIALAIVITGGVLANASKDRVITSSSTKIDAEPMKAAVKVDPFQKTAKPIMSREEYEATLGNAPVPQQFPNCTNPPPHTCYETGPPGCDEYDCCESVCSYDSYCCNYYWDSICVNEALSDPNCAGPPPPPPVGACCTCLNPPYNCSQEEEGICLDWGGIWMGDGITCYNSGLYENTPMIPIQDYQTISDTINVPVGPECIVVDVDIQMDIDHTWIGDLDIDIISPSGTNENIWDRRCSSYDDIRATADDTGTESMCTAIGAGPSDLVLYDEPLASLGSGLSVFEGEPAGGDWEITIYDGAGGDQGTFEYWRLRVVTDCDDPNCEPWIWGNGDEGADESND